MSSPNLKQTVVALAIVQAFSLSAQAQVATEAVMPEVIVTASKDAVANRASVAGFSDAPLMQTPASVVAIGREQMQDLNIRSTTDAVRFDASVGDSYNAVGYAEMFSIRGFLLDNASSYRKDGIAISGDTQIPLENKERIEILKGLAGLTAGVAAPGGVVNYAVKRPTNTPLRTVTLEARERGNLYGAVDLGGRFADTRFGYRINAAEEKLRSYIKGANGERHFISAAFDWQISDKALLQLDMDYQHKSQISASGYQLISGVTLPVNVSTTELLNDQSWARPVDTRTNNVGLRFEYQLNDQWHATLSANKHNFRRDDYSAFPYGCSNEAEYLESTCANGDYDVFDYRSPGERKNPFGAQALLQGKFATGSIRHELTTGASYFKRSDYFGEAAFAYAGSSNIYHNVAVPALDPAPPVGPVGVQRTDLERAWFAQDIVSLAQKFKVHAGLRYVQVERGGKGEWDFLLPSVALVYSPNQDWMTYASLSHGLNHGGEASAQNATNYKDVLAPSRSKQAQLGIKGALNDSTTLSAALFQIKTGLEYYLPLDPVTLTTTFVRAGEQVHRGLELGVQGKAFKSLTYSMSLMALNMRQQGTGTDIDGKRPPNVAPLKSATVLEYAVPSVAGLKLNGIWQYSGKKAVNNANVQFVPAYNVFGLGTAYATRVGGIKTTIRANIDNVADKFYWRDTTPLLGGYLFPGAPRTFKVSAQFDL